MKKKKTPSYFALKKLDSELDSINQKILENIQKHYSYTQALDSISKSIKRLSEKKAYIHSILREKKKLTASSGSLIKIKKMLKK